MCRVTTAAALGFHWHVFIDEGAGLVRMALGADSIAGGQCSRLPKSRCSVDVVAITALDKTLVDPMVVWFGKISFRGCMTSVAEFWLRNSQKVLGLLCVVRRMTI